jgi:predicted RNA binding protein YcfA (HicA-like mRNA interferase family)
MMRRYEVSSDVMLASFEQSGFVIVGSKSYHHYLVHKDDPRRRAIIPLAPGFLSTQETLDIFKSARDPDAPHLMDESEGDSRGE